MDLKNSEILLKLHPKMINRYAFALLCWWIGLSTMTAQTIEIPEKIQFADLELTLDESARAVIGQKTKYLTGNFSRYQNYQEYGRMYFPFVEEAMKKYNIPDDYKYLLLLESTHLNHNPLDGLLRPDSKGFWQMRGTEAKTWGLVMNEDIDERNHVILASDVLMKFFAENNGLLDNWVHTLLTKELGFTQAGEIIDKSLAGKKAMTITKEDHVFLLNFLAHYITFKDKINPDPTAIKLIVYQGKVGEKIQETSQRIALTENITDYNLWNINPDEGLVKPYVVLLPLMPDEEKKAKTFLGDKVIKRKYAGKESETKNEAKDTESEVVAQDSAKTEEKVAEEETEPAEAENTEIVIQTSGNFPVLKNQKTKEMNGKIFVFVEANGLPAIIAQEGQNATNIAKAGDLSEVKFMKKNEITDKTLQTGTVYYFKKKKTKGATKTHLLQESEDLTDVSQIYGVRKSKLLTYNILGENPKFIKYQEIKEGDTEVMGEIVAEDDSVFVGGRVLNLQAKLTGKPKFQVLRKIKKAPKPEPKPLVILEPTADTPLLGDAETENNEADADFSTDSEENNSEEVADNAQTENSEESIAQNEANTNSGDAKSENSSSKSTKIKYEKKPITSDYYIAQPNDTWSGIAYMFSIKQSDLYLWNGSHAEKILYVNQKVRLTPPPAMPKLDEYVMRQGETLNQVAQRYGMNEDEIIKRNMLLTKKLPTGCKIYFADPKTPQGWHTVKPKENFFSIARLYGISFRDLLAWNNMTLESKIYKGTKLALEAGLVGGTQAESQTESPSSATTQNITQNVVVPEQQTPTSTQETTSESTVSESTAQPTNTQRSGMPDIADPATLTMMITKKPETANETTPETPQGDPNVYEVKNDSENIYEIASITGVKTSNLKKWNNLPSGVMDLPKGTKLRITSPEPDTQPVQNTAEPVQQVATAQETTSQATTSEQNVVAQTTPQTEETTAQNTESAEATTVQIPTDADGNDPASLTALILQNKLDKQRENTGGSEETAPKVEDTPAPAETTQPEETASNAGTQNKDLDASYYHEIDAYGADDPVQSIIDEYGVTKAQLIQWNLKYKYEIENIFFEGGERLIIKDPNQ